MSLRSLGALCGLLGGCKAVPIHAQKNAASVRKRRFALCGVFGTDGA